MSISNVITSSPNAKPALSPQVHVPPSVPAGISGGAQSSQKNSTPSHAKKSRRRFASMVPKKQAQTQPNTPSDVHDRRHIADGNVYRIAIEKYMKNNPNLKNRDWKIPVTQSNFQPTSRVRIIAFHPDRLDGGTDKDCSLEDVKDHFAKLAANSSSSPKSHLYVLEGTNPGFVEIFGSHFKIDPAFFSRHQRTALWEQRNDGGNTSKLPSYHDPTRTFFMEYCELLYFGSASKTFSLRNPSDMRHINVARQPRQSKDLDRVGILHRKASFWSETENGVWNALLLVDPPLPSGPKDLEKVILVGNSQNAKAKFMHTTLFQGGYLDFIPFRESKGECPPRTSTLVDICHYLAKHGDQLDKAQNHYERNALMSTFFLQKIIASNYMVLVGYLESNLNELETAILQMEIKEHKRHQVSSVEEKYTVLQSWSHRLPEYGGMVDDILSWHGLAGHGLSKASRQKWAGCTKDFREIQRRLNIIRNRTQILNESFVGLASMAGMQESLDETKAVKLLTVLGFIFVPCSTVATIFSMPEHAPTKYGGFNLYSKIAFSLSGGLTLIICSVLWWYGIMDQLRKVTPAWVQRLSRNK